MPVVSATVHCGRRAGWGGVWGTSQRGAERRMPKPNQRRRWQFSWTTSGGRPRHRSRVSWQRTLGWCVLGGWMSARLPVRAASSSFVGSEGNARSRSLSRRPEDHRPLQRSFASPRRRTSAAASWRLQLEGGTTCRTWTRSPGRWTFSATHRRTMAVSAVAPPSTGTRSTRASRARRRPCSDHDAGTGGAVGVAASVASPARSPPPPPPPPSPWRVAMATAREGRCASEILDARGVWSRGGRPRRIVVGPSERAKPALPRGTRVAERRFGAPRSTRMKTKSARGSHSHGTRRCSDVPTLVFWFFSLYFSRRALIPRRARFPAARRRTAVNASGPRRVRRIPPRDPRPRPDRRPPPRLGDPSAETPRLVPRGGPRFRRVRLRSLPETLRTTDPPTRAPPDASAPLPPDAAGPDPTPPAASPFPPRLRVLRIPPPRAPRNPIHRTTPVAVDPPRILVSLASWPPPPRPAITSPSTAWT